MIMGFIILSILALMLIYLAVKGAVIYNFRRKNKSLSTEELNDLKQNLYWDLDDFGYDWVKAQQYRTAIKMLKERTILQNEPYFNDERGSTKR